MQAQQMRRPQRRMYSPHFDDQQWPPKRPLSARRYIFITGPPHLPLGTTTVPNAPNAPKGRGWKRNETKRKEQPVYRGMNGLSPEFIKVRAGGGFPRPDREMLRRAACRSAAGLNGTTGPTNKHPAPQAAINKWTTSSIATKRKAQRGGAPILGDVVSAFHAPVLGCHNRTLLSMPPLARYAPSGDQATTSTQLRCGAAQRRAYGRWRNGRNGRIRASVRVACRWRGGAPHCGDMWLRRLARSRGSVKGAGEFEFACRGGGFCGCDTRCNRDGGAVHQRYAQRFCAAGSARGRCVAHFVWPLPCAAGISMFRSQKRTVVSPLPLARCFPSGLNDTASTASECPAAHALRKKTHHIEMVSAFSQALCLHSGDLHGGCGTFHGR